MLGTRRTNRRRRKEEEREQKKKEKEAAAKKNAEERKPKEAANKKADKARKAAEKATEKETRSNKGQKNTVSCPASKKHPLTVQLSICLGSTTAVTSSAAASVTTKGKKISDVVHAITVLLMKKLV